ncbi:MAG: hypothetical protein NC402_07965 [Prevotella sp.]|nr:hypothetical protein [Prevotella sp.]MCM1075681.1 hypothetical protein [Ruminococcus sp.]
MKKFLLFGAFAAAALTASAKAEVYWINNSSVYEDYNLCGLVTCVSPDGEYAVVVDDEMLDSYLWKKSEPNKLEYLNNGDGEHIYKMEVYGVNSAGTIVGAYRPYGSNAFMPFYKELNGEIVLLPVPTWVQNSNYAIGISENGNVIGGYVKGGNVAKDDPTQTYSAYWPMIWEKGENGKFSYQYYPNGERDYTEMGSHQGLFVNSMYSDGTAAGTWLGGQLYCGGGSNITALYNQGKVITWNKLDIIEIHEYYRKGEKQEQHWVMRYETIDGKRDGYTDTDYVSAQFTCCDPYGNFFGDKFHVGTFSNLDNNEDADTYHISKGDTYSWGAYNVHTGEWTEADGSQAVSCALNKDVFFVGHNMYTEGIGSTPINYAEKYEIDTNGVNWGGVSKASNDGQVLGLNFTTIDGTGKETVHPFIAVLDQSIVGLQNIVADTEAQHLILVYGDTIEVTGAENVAVYDINGAQVGNSAVTNVNAGVYIVVADGKSHKILVK